MDSSESDSELRRWLRDAAQLSGQKLEAALALCREEEIESLADLRDVHRANQLPHVGFKKLTLSRILNALADARRDALPLSNDDSRAVAVDLNGGGERRVPIRYLYARMCLRIS